MAIYRVGVSDSLPAGIPTLAASAARDTLGGAVGAAGTLPEPVANALLAAARDSFVDGMHVAAAIAAVVGVALAAFAFMTLRDRPEVEPSPEMDEVLVPVPATVPKPARECF